MGLLDLISGSKGLRKPKQIRHQSKTLWDILEAHKNHFLGKAGGKRADLREADMGVTILRETNLEGVDLSGVDLTTTLLPKGYTPPVGPAATRQPQGS